MDIRRRLQKRALRIPCHAHRGLDLPHLALQPLVERVKLSLFFQLLRPDQPLLLDDIAEHLLKFPARKQTRRSRGAELIVARKRVL